MQLKRAIYKAYNNFMPPHSMVKYEKILHTAREKGYELCSLNQFRDLPSSEDKPRLILRHDIDTDPRAALMFAQIEAKYNTVATYFFRLYTWDSKVIQILYKRGHEIGYHHEELTDYAKANHIKDKETVLLHLPQIRQNFARNLEMLRQEEHIKICCAAAHGDFARLKLGLGNLIVSRDIDLRKLTGLVYEAYDEDISDRYRLHVSDSPSPIGFVPGSPFEYLENEDTFLLLTHPRWWHANPLLGFTDDIRLLIQKLKW